MLTNKKYIDLAPTYWRLVLSPGLPGMASVAQSLPVAAVPEELLVVAVRLFMVDVRRFHVPACLNTLRSPGWLYFVK